MSLLNCCSFFREHGFDWSFTGYNNRYQCGQTSGSVVRTRVQKGSNPQANKCNYNWTLALFKWQHCSLVLQAQCLENIFVCEYILLCLCLIIDPSPFYGCHLVWDANTDFD